MPTKLINMQSVEIYVHWQIYLDNWVKPDELWAYDTNWIQHTRANNSLIIRHSPGVFGLPLLRAVFLLGSIAVLVSGCWLLASSVCALPNPSPFPSHLVLCNLVPYFLLPNAFPESQRSSFLIRLGHHIPRILRISARFVGGGGGGG